MEPGTQDECCTAGGTLSDIGLLEACTKMKEQTTTGFTFNTGDMSCIRMFETKTSYFLSDTVTPVGSPSTSMDAEDATNDDCCESGD